MTRSIHTANPHDLVGMLLRRPAERPLLGTLRNLLYGIVLGVLTTAGNVYFGSAWWTDLPAYLIMGLAVAYAGWGGERIWYAMVAPSLRDPFAWYALPAKAPLWFLAGGIGYAVGLQVAKKCGLILIYEVPIVKFFVIGGLIGICVQLLLQLRVYRLIVRSPDRTVPSTTSFIHH